MSNILTFQKLGYFGSIGNQLFQCAALLSYAKDNDLTPKIPNHNGYFEHSYGRFVDYLPNGIDLGIDFLTDKDIIDGEIQEPSFNYTKLPITPNKSLSGYFQSEKHFKHNSDLIKSKFLNFKPKIQESINSIATQLPLNTELTAIHVRRGDYVYKQGFHALLDMSYYESAKEVIGGGQTYVVFSDDVEWCKSNFDDSHYVVESDDPFVDLGLMSYCDNFIIANSSFSWWGAWLNQNSNAKIVAPKKWFGPINSDIPTHDLIPEIWKRI